MLAACPLCMLQRYMYAALALVFLGGSIFALPRAISFIYSSLILLFSITGASLAVRQVWLQYFAPPQKISCAASLERLIDMYPFLDALKMALNGSAECALIDFKIIGLSIAVWSLVMFSTICLTMLYVVFSRQKKRRI
jgi:disulfide bond formation protein DsbB